MGGGEDGRQTCYRDIKSRGTRNATGSFKDNLKAIWPSLCLVACPGKATVHLSKILWPLKMREE